MFGRVGKERVVGAAWGTLFTAILAVLIIAGSRTLQHCDAALVGYTFAVLFATFAITYRYAIWLQPFLLGLTILFWATATWWIPMLVILGIWRHIYKKFPLSYSPLYWGAVFPLGMYTVCTFRLAAVSATPFLMFIPRAFVVIAIAAWAVTFAGLVRSLIRPAFS
jgi:tellurite resistance protein TehA-like permease